MAFFQSNPIKYISPHYIDKWNNVSVTLWIKSSLFISCRIVLNMEILKIIVGLFSAGCIYLRNDAFLNGILEPVGWCKRSPLRSKINSITDSFLERHHYFTAKGIEKASSLLPFYLLWWPSSTFPTEWVYCSLHPPIWFKLPGRKPKLEFFSHPLRVSLFSI